MEDKKKSLPDYLVKDLVFCHKGKISKDEIFEQIIKRWESVLKIGSIDSMREAIFKKEEVAPGMTAIGNKLSIPHGIFFDYTYTHTLVISACRVINGVKGYKSEFDGEKVEYIFMIGYNQDTYCSKRTEIMPQIASIFSNESFIAELDTCTTDAELYNTIISIIQKI